MPFIVDDSFYDDIGASLPDCSVAFLHRAGAWSARNSRSGFVPAAQLARLSDAPDQATGALKAAGLIERAKGGWQIVQRHGIRIVNAAEEEASATARRASDAERQRRSRANRRAAGGVTVTPVSHVTGRSDHDLNPKGKNLSQDQMNPAGHSDSAKMVTAVTAAVLRRLGITVTPDAASRAASVVLARCRGGMPRSPVAYVVKAVESEPDLYAELLLPPAPELSPALPDAGQADRHDFQADGRPGMPGCLVCDLPRANVRHRILREGVS